MSRGRLFRVCGWLFGLLLLTSGCASRTMTSSELQQYVADEGHGLRKLVRKNGVSVELSYRPTDLIIAHNYQHEIRQAPAKVDSLKNALDQYIYFVLKLSRQGKEIEQSFLTSNTYEQASQYMNYELGQHIKLVNPVSKKATGVSDYLYARMYGSTGQSTALIAFEKEAIDDASSFYVELNDTQLGIGTYHFAFATEDLTSIPALTFNTSM